MTHHPVPAHIAAAFAPVKSHDTCTSIPLRVLGFFGVGAVSIYPPATVMFLGKSTLRREGIVRCPGCGSGLRLGRVRRA